MNSYERLYTMLTETRSAASRAKTRRRKLYGTGNASAGGLFGRKGEYAKRYTTGKSVKAYSHGQRSAKDLATAKTYRQASSDTATNALKDTARRKEDSALTWLKAGMQAKLTSRKKAEAETETEAYRMGGRGK